MISGHEDIRTVNVRESDFKIRIVLFNTNLLMELSNPKQVLKNIDIRSKIALISVKMS